MIYLSISNLPMMFYPKKICSIYASDFITIGTSLTGFIELIRRKGYKIDLGQIDLAFSELSQSGQK